MNLSPTIHPSGRTLLFTAASRAMRPRKRLTVSQWADEHRVLTTKASSEPGPWRTSRVPFAREIMDCLSITSTVRSVTLMKAAQVSGTEIGLNWLGCVMDHSPASMLVVVPTLDVRERWVKQRLDPMLEETPALAGIFDAKRKRARANSEAIKDYPGGMVIIGGANSPASLASMPIKYVINDEIDRFPWEVGTEGDPLELIRKRQQTFPRRKELNISSPTIKGASRIEELYEAGDQRHYHVPCPHCDELQALKWANLRWTMDLLRHAPTRAVYVCEHCGCEIEEHHKPQMLERGRWIAKHPERPARSYHINGLYAPLGLGLRWVEMADKWLKAQGDVTKLKAFINTDLGEAWEDRSHDVKPHLLLERAEPWQLREVPPGCLLLTAGVDVQDDRLEVQVVGWGRDWVSFGGIDWLSIPGDTSRLDPWAALYDYLRKPFANRFARELRIEATAIDTGGHRTHEAYHFVRTRGRLREGDAEILRRVMAVKGANHPGKPILVARPQAQDVNWKGKVIKGGVMLWTVGTDTAKQNLYGRLTGDAGLDAERRKFRSGQGLPEDYYNQLTAEAFDPERNKWVKRRGRRNEGMDTWVYAAAASQHPELRAHAMRAKDWQRLEQLLEPAGEAEPPKAPEPVNTGRRQISGGVKKGGFVNRWRR